MKKLKILSTNLPILQSSIASSLRGACDEAIYVVRRLTYNPITLSPYNLKKLLAIFVIVCFFISSTFQNVLASVSVPVLNLNQQIVDDFGIAYNYGIITKAHFAGTDRVVINIQDLHCHPQVQKNISNII